MIIRRPRTVKNFIIEVYKNPAAVSPTAMTRNIFASVTAGGKESAGSSLGTKFGFCASTIATAGRSGHTKAADGLVVGALATVWDDALACGAGAS